MKKIILILALSLISSTSIFASTQEEKLQELGKLTVKFLNNKLNENDIRNFALKNGLIKEEQSSSWKKPKKTIKSMAKEAEEAGYTSENIWGGNLPNSGR